MTDMNRKKRLTIGLAVDNIELVGGRKTLIGASEVARQNDANFLCFHFNLFSGEGKLPAAWNAIGETLDGLIIYQPWPDKEAFNAFKSRFPSLPMINAFRIYPGCPGLSPNSYQGMKDLIIHLAKDHGYTKIGFIRGPENNWSADERFRGYTEALAELNIVQDPKLISPHMKWWEGQQGMSALLDNNNLRPGIDIEAIGAANDTIAMGAIDQLNVRGISCPGQIAVVGGDDDTRGNFSKPPLSSAGYEMGPPAARLMLKMIKGEIVPQETYVPTYQVKRRSCGCQPATIMHARMPAAEPPAKQLPAKEILSSRRLEIIMEMEEVLKNGYQSSNEVSLWTEQVYDSFTLSMLEQTETASSHFLDTLEKIIYQLRDREESLDHWHNAISSMRRQLLPCFDLKTLQAAETQWHQGQLLIKEMTMQKMLYTNNQAESQAAILRDIETKLISTFSVSGIMDILKTRLADLGIPSCFLALYENDEQSRLLLAGDKVIAEDKNHEKNLVQTSLLVPENIYPNRLYCYIIEPLFFQDKQLGYVLFEKGPDDGVIYDSLRGIVSSSLQGALLIDQIRRHSEQLDEIVAHTVTTSEEIQATITETAKQAHLVADAARHSMDVSKTGQDAISDTVTGMDTIRNQVENIADSIQTLTKRTNQIEDILKAVEDIVGQSEVLSINASIQAARAGDKGLGFAVVAREMRNLAQQSIAATANISTILTEIRTAADAAVSATVEGSQKTKEGVTLAGNAGNSIQELAATIEKAADMAVQISSGTEQQSSAISDLVEAVRSIEKNITQSAIN